MARPRYEVQVTRDPRCVRQAQRLRYLVFGDEMGARLQGSASTRTVSTASATTWWCATPRTARSSVPTASSRPRAPAARTTRLRPHAAAHPARPPGRSGPRMRARGASLRQRDAAALDRARALPPREPPRLRDGQRQHRRFRRRPRRSLRLSRALGALHEPGDLRMFPVRAGHRPPARHAAGLAAAAAQGLPQPRRVDLRRAGARHRLRLRGRADPAAARACTPATRALPRPAQAA